MLSTLQRQPVDRVPVSVYEITRFGPWGWYGREPSYSGIMDAVARYAVELPIWVPNAIRQSEPAPTESTSWQEGDFTVWKTVIHTPKGDLTCATKAKPDVRTTWTVEHLCKTVEDAERYLSLPDEQFEYDVSGFAALDSELGDKGLVLCDVADALCHVAPLFEFGEFTIMAMTEPALIRRLCDRAHVRIMQSLQCTLEGGCGPLYRIPGPEYATPPFLPPKAFREFVVPYITEMISLMHSYGCCARVHCHGKTARVLDMIVEAGADAIDPVEPPPDGDISMADIKARYGKDLILFGNMELKYLETETPAQIDARVERMMDEAKAGGGFVLMPTAAPINIPLSPKTEKNYIAYLNAGWKYGKY